MKGLLDFISAIRYENLNLNTREVDFPVVQRFLEDNISSYRKLRIVPGDDEVEKLMLHSI